jgi:CPA1 family monovalent cation:H+ antiporter
MGSTLKFLCYNNPLCDLNSLEEKKMAFNMLCWLTAILTIIIVVNFLNEKIIKFPVEITLLVSGVILGVVAWYIDIRYGLITGSLDRNNFFLNDYLMNGVLCFMLFAGASRLRFGALESQLSLVSALSVVSTVVTSFVYGIIFYGALKLAGIEFGLHYCLLLGAIIGPTDPIAAMSILHKIGLPKGTSLAIEGESLFNDGVGVAVFVVMSGLVTGQAGGNFFSIMAKELFGAVLLGLVFCALSYFFFSQTKDCYARVCSSIVAVGGAYIFSDILGCSGAIASVVVGIFYATRVANLEDIEGRDYVVFRTFWDAMNIILNNMLYVIIGLSIIDVRRTDHLVYFVVAALIVNLIARYAGVLAVAVPFKKKLPDGYTPLPFTNILTWAGLKGGLCVALAMGTHQMLPAGIFNIILVCTMAIVLFTTCIQGITVGKFYLWQNKIINQKSVLNQKRALANS